MRRLLVPRTLAVIVAAALLTGAFGLLRPHQPTAARARGNRIAIALGDYRLKPQRVVAHRGLLTIELRDAGRVPHAFHLLRGDRVTGRQRTLKPGAAGVLTVHVRPGSYRMLCPLSNHSELGMYGTLTVLR